MKHPDMVPSLRALLDNGGHEPQRLHGRIVRRLVVGGAKLPRARIHRQRQSDANRSRADPVCSGMQ
jgi:hypothetical protein